MTRLPTSSESAASAIRFFGKPGGLIMVVLLLLAVECGEAKIRKNVHVPAIMKRLYMHKALDGCESPNPVFSILANGSPGSTTIEFNLTYGDNVDADRTRLSLDLPRACVAEARPPPEVELKATASGWTGTRQLRFRRRGASYSPRRRSGSNPGNGLCRRIKLYVEFRDMGWDKWVLAPGGYWAHQCDGRCVFPMSAKMNVTNHATVRSLVHSMVTAGVRAPCCVPVKLAPQNLLYIDSYGHVVLKTFPDMTVTDCGCR
ncbi:unnamed protein product [Ixodes hexagonus]